MPATRPSTWQAATARAGWTPPASRRGRQGTRARREGSGASWPEITMGQVGDPPKRLFLLDGHSLSYRAYFALPPDLATSTGQVTNAVYGFTLMLIKLLGEEKHDFLAFAFFLGSPMARLVMYVDYKDGRRATSEEIR